MSEVPEGLVAASAAAAAAAAVAVGGGGGGGGAGRGQHHHRPGGQPRGQREKTREARTARRPRQVLGTRVVEAAHHHRRRVGRRLHDTTKKKETIRKRKIYPIRQRHSIGHLCVFWSYWITPVANTIASKSLHKDSFSSV